MRFGSLFSGVGGFDLGLERAGHECVFQAESDPYRRRVLKRHWPDVPCYEDVRDVGVRCLQPHGDTRGTNPAERHGRGHLRDVDLLCGGFPCQDLSVAGRRAGLAGERSGLFFEFARIADALLGDGGWVLIENVPGLLSSQGGRDFAVILATLAELGFHDLAWRVLDSRHFGVPQRRRRVFILARRASGGRAATVLLERESGDGHPAPRGEERTGVAGSAPLSLAGSLNRRDNVHNGQDDDGSKLVVSTPPHAHGVRAPSGLPGFLDGGVVSIHPDAIGRDGIAKTDSPDAEGVHRKRNAGLGVIDDGSSYTVTTGAPPGVFNLRGREEGARVEMTDAASLRASSGGSSRSYVYGLGTQAAASPFDPQPDGRRYAAMGDAVTVNVLEWIGHRLNDKEVA